MYYVGYGQLYFFFRSKNRDRKGLDHLLRIFWVVAVAVIRVYVFSSVVPVLLEFQIVHASFRKHILAIGQRRRAVG